MSTTPVWHLQNTSTLSWTIDGTEFPVAGVQDASVALTQNVVELFTGDSTTREASYSEEKVPEVEITVSRWNHELLESAVMDGTGSLDDTSEIPPTSFEGTFEDGEGGDRTVTLALEGGTTDEWPFFDLSTGDYGEWTLTMRFDDFTQFSIEDPA